MADGVHGHGWRRDPGRIGARAAVIVCRASIVSAEGFLVPVAVTLILLVFWLVLAYRRFLVGDLLLAVIFLLVGVALTAYRLRSSQAKQSTGK
jgi:hypothetical protein